MGKREREVEHWRWLLQKDLLLWRNSYWRTRAQAVGTLVVAALLTGAAVLVTRALLRWFLPIAEMFRSGVTAEMLSPLVMVVLTWLLISTFFATAQLSREHFLLTPDLALLMATPARPRVIFTLRFLFLALAPTSMVEVVMFGLAPLAALGLMAAAPWHYYALLLPLLYFYRTIPAVFSVISIMLLARVLSPRRLYQALVVWNCGLGIVPLLLFFGDRQLVLHRWATQLAGVELALLAPLAAMRDVVLGLMGADVGVWLPLVILSSSVVACMALAAAVVERLYFTNYERLQAAERLRPRKVTAQHKAPRAAQLPLLWFLVVEHWKTAARNREMLPAGLTFVSMLIVYVVSVGRFGGGQPWVMLLNVAAVAVCAQVSIMLLLVPIAAATDPGLIIWQKQYWCYKVAPVDERIFTASLVLAHGLPALVLGWVLITPVTHFTGLPVRGMLPAAGLLTLLLVSSVALSQLGALVDATARAGPVPLLGRVTRVAANLYVPLFMLFPVLTLYYRQLGFLSFMHGAPPAVVTALAALASTVLATAVTWGSWRRLAAAWQVMEIR